MLSGLVRAVLDVVLPPGCARCEAPVAVPGQLCADCFKSMAFIADPACRQCGLPFASRPAAGLHHLCAGCLADPPPWGRGRAAMTYDEAAKSLILPFKHAGREENAQTLALHMHRAGAALLAEADLLVPVPLHRARLRQRRYNQSALLTAALARRTGLRALPDLLVRTRPTEHLGGRGAAARAKLLDGAIAVRPSRAALARGRRVVLVDDVLTSGATARACAHALLGVGVAGVDVLVASRVADPRVDGVGDSDDADD